MKELAYLGVKLIRSETVCPLSESLSGILRLSMKSATNYLSKRKDVEINNKY